MAPSLPPGLFFDYVSADEVPAAHELELSGYPTDEAGSLGAFQERQFQAPNLFLGAFILSSLLTSEYGTNTYNSTGNGNLRLLIGYVCATLSPSPMFTHESMSTHVPGPGPSSVCIHSVCVSHAFRRRGIALALLKEYCERLKKSNDSAEMRGQYARVLLIVHEELRTLYEKAGFLWLGKSRVVHGAKPWYEMRMDLGNTLNNELTDAEPLAVGRDGMSSIPPGLLEALHRSPNLSTILSLEAIGGMKNVETIDESSGAVVRNRFDLLCPRDGCGSIILKKGVANSVEQCNVEVQYHPSSLLRSIDTEDDNEQLEPPSRLPMPPLRPLPAPSECVHCWLVRPNPMAFENIGFSQPVTSQLTDNGRQKQFLICAECDLGPLGWRVEGGSDFWLVCDRVGYRTT